MMTDTEIQTFHENGYHVAEDVFPNEILQQVIDEISQVVDERARQAFEDGEIRDIYEDADFEHRLALLNAQSKQIASSMWNSNLVMPSFFHLMRTPKLLDIVEQLVGPEIIASSVYRLRPKVPSHDQSAVPWHQDSGYFEPYCDQSLVLTVWLPLVDATEENGCLWVKPRGHLSKQVVPHRQREGKPYLEIPDDVLNDMPGDDPVCVPVKKGGCLMLTNLLPHGSYENRTDMVRWSMDLRYQSAALPTNANITRLPGESQPDETTGVPIACYPPEADFLIRSKARPDEVVTDASVFQAMRANHVRRPVTTRFDGVWK